MAGHNYSFGRRKECPKCHNIYPSKNAFKRSSCMNGKCSDTVAPMEQVVRRAPQLHTKVYPVPSASEDTTIDRVYRKVPEVISFHIFP